SPLRDAERRRWRGSRCAGRAVAGCRGRKEDLAGSDGGSEAGRGRFDQHEPRRHDSRRAGERELQGRGSREAESRGKAVQRRQRFGHGGERAGEVAAERFAGPPPHLYGSAASRRPSPRKLKASTTIITGTTGSSSQG